MWGVIKMLLCSQFASAVCGWVGGWVGACVYARVVVEKVCSSASGYLFLPSIPVEEVESVGGWVGSRRYVYRLGL